MQAPIQDRWELVLAAAFLVAIVTGVYFANRTKTPIAPIALAKRATATESQARARPSASSSAADAGARAASGPSLAEDDPAAVTPAAEQDGDCAGEAADRQPRGSVDVPTELSKLLEDADGEVTARLMRLGRQRNPILRDAYAAYLLVIAERSDAAQQALQRVRRALPQPLCRLARADPGARPRDTPLQVAVRTIRLAVETSGSWRDSLEVACPLFEKHPGESAVAFGVLWGTSRDELGRDVKKHCVTYLLRQEAPRVAEAALQATEALCNATLRVSPMPTAPLYRSVHMATCDLLRDAMLTPELTDVGRLSRVKAELEAHALREPAIGARLPGFNSAVETRAPALASGICAILRARGLPATAAVCVRRAEQAAAEALASWLSATAPDGLTSTN